MLTVVGTGYDAAAHTTSEARTAIEAAGRLLYLMTDPASADWLRKLQPRSSSLHSCYRESESGVDASLRMVEAVLAALREVESVCAAFSGHPMLCMHTTRELIRRARREGHRVQVLPGLSFEDCLVADLGVDPGQTGRALYDATDFVLRPRPVDTRAALVLLQVGVIGEREYRGDTGAHREGLRLLQETLTRHFPPEHEVVLYQASQLPVAGPSIVRLPLAGLASGPVRVNTTLYVPPVEPAALDPEILHRLGYRPCPG